MTTVKQSHDELLSTLSAFFITEIRQIIINIDAIVILSYWVKESE